MYAGVEAKNVQHRRGFTFRAHDLRAQKRGHESGHRPRSDDTGTFTRCSTSWHEAGTSPLDGARPLRRFFGDDRSPQAR